MTVTVPPRPLVLVYLAAGVQGSAAVRAALARGLAVRALVRERARAPLFPADRVEFAEGDLDDLASLQAASAGVTHAVLQIPTGPVEAMAAQARNAASASITAGLRSVVLRLASASRSAPCAEPSFVGNAQVEDALRQAGLVFASVRPTMYLDNLLKPSVRSEIVDSGIFAPPLADAQRIAWTCVDDCARAAIDLLVQGATGDHRIAGPESLSGDELAARISVGLGRRIAYRAQPVDAFEREVDAAIGEGMGRRVASKFRYFASHPDEANSILARPFEPHAGLAGFEPTDVATWVRRHRHAFIGTGAQT
jgi:uncharacterized protein YbjT (DUF2867 family)